MKIEIEIDDNLALALSSSAFTVWQPDTDEATKLKLIVEDRLREYAHRPEIVQPRHGAALAIVRAQAAEQASRSTSDKHYSTVEAAAERLLNFMLDGR